MLERIIENILVLIWSIWNSYIGLPIVSAVVLAVVIVVNNYAPGYAWQLGLVLFQIFSDWLA